MQTFTNAVAEAQIGANKSREVYVIIEKVSVRKPERFTATTLAGADAYAPQGGVRVRTVRPEPPVYVMRSPVLPHAACVWQESEGGFVLRDTKNSFRDFDMNVVDALAHHKGAEIFDGTLEQFEKKAAA